MSSTFITVNYAGLAKIKKMVLEHTGQELTEKQALAYAADIEEHWVNNGVAICEIASHLTHSHNPVLIELDDVEYDEQPYDDVDE